MNLYEVKVGQIVRITHTDPASDIKELEGTYALIVDVTPDDPDYAVGLVSPELYQLTPIHSYCVVLWMAAEYLEVVSFPARIVS